MAVNKGVVTGAVGIVAIGSFVAFSQGRGITRIAIGGYLVAVVGSLLDLVPGAGPLAGALVMAALVGVIFTELQFLPGLAQIATASANPPPSAPAGPAPVGPGPK